MPGKAYEFVLELFNFSELDGTLHRDMQKASLKGGILNSLSGIIIAVLSLLALTFISVVYLGYVYDTLPVSSLISAVRPSLTSGLLLSSTIYFGLITLPFLFIWIFIHQGMMFLLSRLFKGTGSFSTQYFLTSFITLAIGSGSLGFVPVLILSVFLPCFNLFFFLLFLVASIYLVFYVQSKMLVAVHRISFPAAFIIVLISFLAFMAVYALLQFVLFTFGVGPDFTASFGSTSSPSVNLTDITTIHLVNNSSVIQ